MATPLHVLLVEADEADAAAIIAELQRGGYAVTAERVWTQAAFEAALLTGGWAIILSEFKLPAFPGLEALASTQHGGGGVPLIFVSGQMDEAAALAAMRAGAADYVRKSNLSRLRPAIERALREAEDHRARKRLEQEAANCARQQAMLAEYAQWALDNMPAAELFAGTAERVVRALDVEFCEVLEVMPRQESFLLCGGAGWQAGCVGHIQLAVGAPSQEALTFQQGEAVHVGDWHAEPRFQPSALLREHAVASGLTVPIRLPHRTIGVLGAHASRLRVFAAGDAHFLQVTANILATAIERKRAEVALRESDERFRALVDEVKGFGIITLDPEACVLTWNQGAEQLFGHRAADIVGQHVARLYPAADVELGKPELDLRLAEEMGQFEDEDWRVQSGGGQFWANVVITALRRGDGALRGFGMVTRDMTEQRRAHEALKLNEAKFRSLVNHIPDAVWTMNQAGEQLFLSGSAEQIFGYTIEELRGGGRALGLDRIHADDAPRVLADWQALFERQARFEAECRYKRKDGRQVWLLMRASAIYEKDGQWVADGIASDITERKQSEEQIRAQARLLDLAGDAIIVRNLSHEVLYWNHGAESIYGWSAVEVRGRRVTELVMKDTQPFEAAQAELLETGEWKGELKQFARNGREVIVSSRWTLVRDDAGQPTSVLVLNTDITENKRLENQFLRAQRMESIGTLAGGVAHDLNNILSPIMMSAPLLRMRELPAADFERLLDTVEINAQRGSDIVRQLLAFGRGIEGERVVVQPRHMIREMSKIARETFPKNLAIVTEVADKLWPISGDPTHLHQVLLNLCINARDAMPGGGTLKIIAENQSIDEHYAAQHTELKPGPHLSLRVIDTGHGIPREIMDKIFEPFFTTKEVGKGTGLGLATVIGIVKSHGGTITVTSEIGKGTSFNILLPALPGAAAAGEDGPRQPLPKGNGETVLVVDDEPGILEATVRLLRMQNYQVLVAADGAEALSVFSRNRERVQVILTDVMMPEMDGLALARVVRRMAPELKLIASSGLARDAKFEELRALGVNAFLTKPYSADKLLQVLREVLSNPRDPQG